MNREDEREKGKQVPNYLGTVFVSLLKVVRCLVLEIDHFMLQRNGLFNVSGNQGGRRKIAWATKTLHYKSTIHCISN